MEGRVEGIKNFRILVREVNGNVVFLHKIIEGGTNKSFGIEVASFAGLPKVVVERAKTVARELEKNKIIVPTNINISEPKFSDDSDKENNKKDFTKLFNLLSKINVNNCSPMQALGILENLVNLFNEADKI